MNFSHSLSNLVWPDPYCGSHGQDIENSPFRKAIPAELNKISLNPKIKD